jgi:hypothetical protein
MVVEGTGVDKREYVVPVEANTTTAGGLPNTAERTTQSA